MASKYILQPLFILGSPRSFTSVVCGMLGQHPQIYGVPELNLFVADRLGEMLEWTLQNRHLMLHGLLRTVAHLYTGEQTLHSVQMAHRWILNRIVWSTAEVYWELCERVAPLRIIDKSPAYSVKPIFLQRLAMAFPEASYLHLVRHPRTQGESMMKLSGGVMATWLASYDYSTQPPTLDPQISWYTVQCNILDFLSKVPSDRQLRMRGEDILTDPLLHLRQICKWLGISAEDDAIEAMFHPEHAFFAYPGPWGANGGADINFLRSPHFKPGKIKPSTLYGPLPWRRDRRGFHEEVIKLARMFEYDFEGTGPVGSLPHISAPSASLQPQDRSATHQGEAPMGTADIVETSTTQEEIDRRRGELQHHEHCLRIMLELTQTELDRITALETHHAKQSSSDPTGDNRSQAEENQEESLTTSLVRLLEKPPALDTQAEIDLVACTTDDLQRNWENVSHRIDWLQAVIALTQNELDSLPKEAESTLGDRSGPSVVVSPQFHNMQYARLRPHDPAPLPGLRREQFRKVCQNGFGDGNNSYAHSMIWFKDALYVGTTRANLCFIRKVAPVKIGVWPVECPYLVYSPDFEREQARAEIWRYHPLQDRWERVLQSPLVDDGEGGIMSRELGYRRMVVYQGRSDRFPVLYVSTWSRSKKPGMMLLRSEDGTQFSAVSESRLASLAVTSIRSLVPFRGRLFAAPTGAAGVGPNTSNVAIVYESSDPASGEWTACNEPGFGDRNNRSIFEIIEDGEHLYAGTINNKGFQLWRTRAEGTPPYAWEPVILDGAGRGSLNQIAVSMAVFNNAIYLGTGIQSGGCDPVNKIGPAGAELLRINRDGGWNIIVGDERNTTDGHKRPLSGLRAGLGSLFNGIIWKMEIHDGWLYAGTLHWAIILRFCQVEEQSETARRLLEKIGVERMIDHQSGFQLWRTCDGENWLPVCRHGFGNPYNYGIRNLVSTEHGLFLGTANPFGPRVAVRRDNGWAYEDNAKGGLEVWLGKPVKPVG